MQVNHTMNESFDQPYYFVNLQQGSTEWLEFRRKHIGASDAASILGISPWTTLSDLWADKNGIAEEKVMTEAMQRGHDLEPQARAMFFMKQGIGVYPEVAVSKVHPWMMVSIDGLSSDRKTYLEIKCGGRKLLEMAKKGIIPDYYMTQMQHGLAVLNLDIGYYMVYWEEGNSIDSEILTVMRNQEYIDNLIVKEKAFWDSLQSFTPPEVTATYIADDEWAELKKEWVSLIQKEKEIESQKEMVREKIVRKANNHEAYGSGFKLTKVTRKGNVSYKDIPELTGVDLEKYRSKSTSYWMPKVED